MNNQAIGVPDPRRPGGQSFPACAGVSSGIQPITAGEVHLARIGGENGKPVDIHVEAMELLPGKASVPAVQEGSLFNAEIERVGLLWVERDLLDVSDVGRLRVVPVRRTWHVS